jgi:cytochrome P450
MVASWSEGQVRDLYAEARALTVRVAARTLFGQMLGSEAERARIALEQAVSAFDRFKRSPLPLPLAVPTPAGLQLRRATQELERLIYRTIAQRRKSSERKLDLLSLLLDARDAEGAPLTDREIRDEAITMFAGSTETSASALAWACYLLASHDDVMCSIRAEVAGVVGDGSVRLGHVARLGYVDKVVKETLRLYPPVWRTSREALDTYSLNGFAVRKGKQVVASQYLIHRNPRYFPDPERFNPARWNEDFTRSLPKFAYFPFGGGQRVCIGQALATTVLTVTLATIVARVRFETTAQKPEPKASTMLRPRAGVQLRVLRARALGQAIASEDWS